MIRFVLKKIYRWEPKEKLHLTLKFIGDVSDEMIDKISNELLFVNNYQSIKCSFSKFGFFYRDNKPKILWAGLDVDDSLFDMITEVNTRLEKLSIPIEKRKFNPHITLLRIKNRSRN